MFIRFLREAYDPENRTLTLFVAPLACHLDGEFAQELGDSSEDIGDLGVQEGLYNFATSKYGTLPVALIRVIAAKDTLCTLSLTKPTSALASACPVPSVPGVTFDITGAPLADSTCSLEEKQRAVVQVAKSQLGAPYIWGHHEDIGQQGFDHSSFTQFVYRRALGYRFSRIAREQAKAVGHPVAARDMRAGDLLIFDKGAHVGIHAGDEQMISQGGGRGHIGYLRIDNGSYWRRRLTAVKRMF